MVLGGQMKTETVIKREDLDLYTVHQALQAIKNLGVELTPEQEFRVTAIIKRHVHYEKADLYKKIKHWVDDYDSDFLKQNDVLTLKIQTHDQMKKLPDEEIVTWSIGSHVFI